MEQSTTQRFVTLWSAKNAVQGQRADYEDEASHQLAKENGFYASDNS